MNLFIQRHFDAVEAWLITSPAILAYQILRREVSAADGKLRVSLALSDGGSAELFEYVADVGGRIHLAKYSFHWQDAQGNLLRRWDNAPHYPSLPNAPHHLHAGSGPAQGITQVPDLFLVIGEIEKALR
jgi:hypothetical protein